MNKYKIRHKLLSILNEQDSNANIKWIDLNNNKNPFSGGEKIASYEEFCLTKDQLSKKLKMKVSDVIDQLSYLSQQDEIKTYEYGVKITLKGKAQLGDRFYLEENKHYNFESFKRWCNYIILPLTICSILVALFIKIISFDPNSFYLNKMKNNNITKDITNQCKLKIEPSVIDTSFSQEKFLVRDTNRTKHEAIISDSLSSLISEDSLEKK